MNKQNVYRAIGFAAFVIGGLLARSNAMEAAEKLEAMATRKKEQAEAPAEPYGD